MQPTPDLEEKSFAFLAGSYWRLSGNVFGWKKEVTNCKASVRIRKKSLNQNLSLYVRLKVVFTLDLVLGTT